MAINTKPIILASASPRRRGLLKEIGLKFKVLPSHCDESTVTKRPSAIVMELALRKALSVAKGLKRGIVIGADTIVVIGGKVTGKPDDEKHALKILFALNGSKHKVYSGVAVVDVSSGVKQVSYAVSTVKMRKLPPGQLKALAHKHLDKAGAYAIQEKEDCFVEKIEGDYFNVVGLPLTLLKGMLIKFGIKVPRPLPKAFY